MCGCVDVCPGVCVFVVLLFLLEYAYPYLCVGLLCVDDVCGYCVCVDDVYVGCVCRSF